MEATPGCRAKIEVVIDNEKEDFKGFVRRLRDVPDALVEQKQRAIEKVRHLLLYDMSGSREDAFSAMLRQVIRMLAELPPAATAGGRGGPAPLRRLPGQRHMQRHGAA